MVTKIVRYACEICGHKYETEAEARACELSGTPTFVFEVGEYIPEVEATVLERFTRKLRYGHTAMYKLDKKFWKTHTLTEASLLRFKLRKTE